MNPTHLTTLLLTGVVNSPNYPSNYPDNLKLTHTIQVKQGLILSLEFAAFHIEQDTSCRWDHLTIMDGDGTTLMERSCGPFYGRTIDNGKRNVTYDNNIVIGDRIMNTSWPANIHSRSHIVKLFFTSSGSFTQTGWSINWNAVTPGVMTPGELLTPFYSLILSSRSFRGVRVSLWECKFFFCSANLLGLWLGGWEN